MDRRTFLVRMSATLVAAPAAATLLGCAEDEREDYIPPPGGGASGGGGGGGGEQDPIFSVMNSDQSGHYHSFDMRCSHASANGYAYTAEGGHTHRVELSRDDLARIFAGDTVTIETTDGHPHTWVIRLPDSVCSAAGGGGGW
jgi:hypothetical protein